MVAAITPTKEKEVGTSTGMRKQQPKKLPLAYCLRYVIWLTKLDDELPIDEVLISQYVFGNVEDMDER